MIYYTKGDILSAEAEALVNTVNEVGVMGKGIALMFREAFPANARAYQQACRDGVVRVGRMFVTENVRLLGPRWIINFPTKRHWRQPAQMDWIREGLADLVSVVRDRGIRSVAVPPLGCGNGGLIWNHVRREIEAALAQLPDVECTVYEPSPAYWQARKVSGSSELTAARALVVELVHRYCQLGMDCTLLEVQKLAWFLQRAVKWSRLSDPLLLTFVPHRYGPYADRLRHLLEGLDGAYLHCERRLADARPFDLIWPDESAHSRIHEYLTNGAGAPYRAALDHTAQTVEGFETPLGLELLATVDWVLAERKAGPTLDQVRAAVRSWPGGRDAGARKSRLFDDRLLELAIDRLACAFAKPS